jgi:hypothetical protein
MDWGDSILEKVIPIRRIVDVRDGTHDDTSQYVEDSDNSFS